jgi:hypothetical protein
MAQPFLEIKGLNKSFGSLSPAETDLMSKSIRSLHKGVVSVGCKAKARS